MDNVEIFERIADRYDTAERAGIAEVIAERIRGQLPDARNMRAMDYGCGTGLVGIRLARSFRSMLFVDASRNMVEVVREKISGLGIGNAETLVADFGASYPADLRVDCIIVSQVLLHVRETGPLLLNLAQLLNAGGHLVLIDFDKNERVVSDRVHNGFEQSALAGALFDSGFSVVASETFYHGEKMFMNQDASLFILDAVKR